ncbi:MAG TPA: Hsp20/alpha crystallin family protein, partial [Sphaerochaeta sp.]|nr:Hsp20/alpha crystallin family protein [Sphaerochaeta sp.]
EGINEEAIEAEFKNGILTITLPKLPVEQPRKIAVKVTD